MARAPGVAPRRARDRAAPLAVPADAQLLPRRAGARAHRRGRARPGRCPIARDGPDATIERRTALRTLLDDLARLPELQRHALLRRELDGVSHDELASELGLSSGATRSLVHRARGALTRAAEGRTVGCTDVRPDIFDAYDRRRRPTARTLRHLATCQTCRALQSALRAQRRRLAVLAPPAGLLALLGAGTLKPLLLGGNASAAKATTIASTLVVAAGVSVELFEAGRPAPVAVSSIALPGNAARRRLADPRRHRDRAARGDVPGPARGRARLSRRDAPRGPTPAARRTDQRALRAHHDRRRPGRPRRPDRRARGRARARDRRGALPPARRRRLDRRRLARAVAARGRHRSYGGRVARRAGLVRAARQRQGGRTGGRRTSLARVGAGADRHGRDRLAAAARAGRHPSGCGCPHRAECRGSGSGGVPDATVRVRRKDLRRRSQSSQALVVRRLARSGSTGRPAALVGGQPGDQPRDRA